MSNAPIPIFSHPDWREQPGAELASIGSMEDEDIHAGSKGVQPMLGLAYVPGTDRMVAPRVDALQRATLKVEDLDDEELLRGQVRDADGKFRSGPLRQIPREFHDELMRRVLEKGTDKLRAQYLNAIDVGTDLMNDAEIDPTLRWNIAKYIIERLGGKTPDRVEHAVALKPWEVVLKGVIKEAGPMDSVDMPHIVDNDIIDATVEDD